MSDINLLPGDLKKEEEKALKNREDFNLDEIEFTDGEKLKKELGIGGKIFSKNKLGKWLKPKVKKELEFKKDYSKVADTNFIPKIENKQEDIKKEIKIPEVNKDEIKKQKDGNLKAVIKIEKSKLDKQIEKGVDKKEKSGNIFKKLFGKFNLKTDTKKKKIDKKKEGFDVNLLPFGSNVPTTRRLISILIITFIISSSLICIVYFGYFIYKDNIIKDYSSLGNEVDSYMEEIKKYDDLMQETTAWQEKVTEIEHLLNKHIYWTKFFEKLEENTLPDVQFMGFAGSIDTSVVLEAIAPNYHTVSEQWIRLEEADDFIERLEINGAQMITSKDNIGISFSLMLDFVDGIFYNE